jgi:hypothetical protein
MARYFKAEREQRKKGRLERLCSWLCIPLHRRPTSYVDPAPNLKLREDIKQVFPHCIVRPDHGTRNDKPLFHYREGFNDGQPAQARYHTALPQCPISRSHSAQPPLARDYQSSFAASMHNSTPMRYETQSPDYDAPRVNGRPELNVKTTKNKDLPGPLCAQPSPLTKAVLEMNECRNSSSSHCLVDLIPESPQRPVRRWSSTYQDVARSELRLQRARKDRRAHKKANTKPLRTSYDGWHNSCPLQSQKEPQGPRLHQPARSHILHTRPDIVPLSNDSGRVLVHSKSRGFKIVRNLLSIDGMHEMTRNELRNVASLERMAEDNRQACQELSSQ